MTHEQTDGKPTADSILIEAMAAGHLSRRQFVQRASVLGLSAATVGAVLAACGGEETSESTEPTGTDATETTLDDGQTASTAPTGTYKVGGVLKVGNQRPGSPLDPVAMDNVGTYTICATAF